MLKSHRAGVKMYEWPSVILNPQNVRKMQGEYSNPKYLEFLGLGLPGPSPYSHRFDFVTVIWLDFIV